MTNVISLGLVPPTDWAIVAEFNFPPGVVYHPSIPQRLVEHIGLTSLAVPIDQGLLLACAVEADSLETAEAESSGIIESTLGFLALPDESVARVEITPMTLGN